jgi:hypothetical protein
MSGPFTVPFLGGVELSSTAWANAARGQAAISTAKKKTIAPANRCGDLIFITTFSRRF